MSFIDRMAAALRGEAILETKQGPRLVSTVTAAGDVPAVYSQTNYLNLAKYGYNSNPYVFHGIMQAADAAAGITLKVRQGKTIIDGREKNHPVLKLLRSPNPEQACADLMGEVFSYYFLAGNAYLLATRSKKEATGGMTVSGRPLELWTMRPDRVRVRPDPKLRVRSYLYTLDDLSKPDEFPKANVLHWKAFAADDDYYGLSPVKVAMRAVDQLNAANDANLALLQNFMKAPGAFITEALLNDDDLRDLRREIRTKYQGPKNSSMPLILHGGLKFEKQAFSPTEMDWLEGMKFAAVQILLAIGIPPELGGIIEQKTYSNQSEARKGLLEETILPRMDRFLGRLNTWLPPMYGEEFEIFYDPDDIEALQEDRQTRRTFVFGAFDRGLFDVDTALKELGYQPVGGNVGTLRIMPGSVKRIEDIIEPPAPPAGASAGFGGPTGPKPGAGEGGTQKPTKPVSSEGGDANPSRTPGARRNEKPGGEKPTTGKSFPSAVEFLEAVIADQDAKYAPGQPRDDWGRWASYRTISDVAALSRFDAASQADIEKALGKFGLSQAQLQANADQLMSEAIANLTPDELAAAANWYQHGHDVCGMLSEKFGVNAARVAAMTAATSPRNAWDDKANGQHGLFPNIHDTTALLFLADRNPSVTLGDAEQAIVNKYFKKYAFGDLAGQTVAWNDLPPEVAAGLYKGCRQIGNTYVGYGQGLGPSGHPRGSAAFPQGILKAIRVQRGDSIETTLGGNKVRSFYNNLLDPQNVTGLNSVTIDTWQVQALALGGTGKQPRGPNSGMLVNPQSLLNAGGMATTTGGKKIQGVGTYPAFAAATAQAGAKVGLSPNQAQAVIWVYARNKYAAAVRKDGAVLGQTAREMVTTGAEEEEAA